MNLFFKRNGSPYEGTVEEQTLAWADDCSKNKVVSQTLLPNGYRVSTIWLGLDHGSFGNIPLIFETMVFLADGWTNLDEARYATEEQAYEGHKKMVEKWEKVGKESEK